MAEETALATVAEKHIQLARLSDEIKALIKRTVARDATDDELALFLYVAEKTGLDPLTRQIHFVKRRVQDGKGNWIAVGTIQTGIDGFRVIAQRTGKYVGRLGPFWCGEDGVWKDVWLEKMPPVAAKVGIMRSDFREPIWAIAKYEAYCQRKTDGSPTRFWTKAWADPQLAKCAEALGIRVTFPQDLSGLYSHEEMAQADSEQIIEVSQTQRQEAGIDQKVEEAVKALPGSPTEKETAPEAQFLPEPDWDAPAPEVEAAIQAELPIDPKLDLQGLIAGLGLTEGDAWAAVRFGGTYTDASGKVHTPSTPTDDAPQGTAAKCWSKLTDKWAASIARHIRLAFPDGLRPEGMQTEEALDRIREATEQRQAERHGG